MAEYVDVTVRDASGAKRQTVSVPEDVPIGRWLSTMVTKLGLPTQQSDGRLLIYKMHHKRSGKTLNEEDSLQDVGVEPQDTIQLVPEVTAGADGPRMRRLRADCEKVRELTAGTALIDVESTTGDPPEEYVIRYSCTGISHLKKGKPVFRRDHRVSVQLPAEYPFSRSGQTPLVAYLDGKAWHPNIYGDGSFCYGSWHPGMSLDELLVEIGEIIQYKSYGLDDAANLDAATWARGHSELFPVDDRSLRGGEEFGVFFADGGEDEFDIRVR